MQQEAGEKGEKKPETEGKGARTQEEEEERKQKAKAKAEEDPLGPGSVLFVCDTGNHLLRRIEKGQVWTMVKCSPPSDAPLPSSELSPSSPISSLSPFQSLSAHFHHSYDPPSSSGLAAPEGLAISKNHADYGPCVNFVPLDSKGGRIFWGFGPCSAPSEEDLKPPSSPSDSSAPDPPSSPPPSSPSTPSSPSSFYSSPGATLDPFTYVTFKPIQATNEGFRLNEPTGIAIREDGSIFISNTGNHTILRLSPTQFKENQTPIYRLELYAGINGRYGKENKESLSSTFYQPKGLCLDRHGDLLIADCANHQIRRVSQNGEVTTFAGAGVAGNLDSSRTSSLFKNPSFLRPDPHGNIYVSDSGNYRIKRILPSGFVETVAGSGISCYKNDVGKAGGFISPQGLAIDPASGMIFLADHHRIRSVAIPFCTEIPPSTYLPDLGSLLNHPTIGDVTFEVEGKKITAVKAILMARSPYFSTMFSSSMQEGQPGSVVQIKETSYQSFMALLRFIFTESVVLDYENAIEVSSLPLSFVFSEEGGVPSPEANQPN